MKQINIYKVYRYTFPDGKIYIGATRNSIEQRRDNGYQHNKPLQAALRQAGWSRVKVDILAECDDASKAFQLEKQYISEHKATNPKIGYNVSNGGKSTFKGLRHTEEHKRYMSRILKGRKFSDEHKRRIRAAHEKYKKPVVCIDETGIVVGTYSSLREAARETGGYPSNISRACTTGRKYKGLMWARKEVV